MKPSSSHIDIVIMQSSSYDEIVMTTMSFHNAIVIDIVFPFDVKDSVENRASLL